MRRCCYSWRLRAATMTRHRLILLSYSVAFPIACYWVLRRALLDAGANDKTNYAKFSFIYRGVRPSVWWFRLLTFAFNFAIALEACLLLLSRCACTCCQLG